MIDLCKVFGVEEGEEFRISTFKDIYKIHDGLLFNKCPIRNIYVEPAEVNINDISGLDIYKLPKKKEFTPFEYEVFRRIDPKYKWVARDISGNLYAYADKPEKLSLGSWGSHSYNGGMSVFNHLFKSITAEDEEPLFIDDYVKR